MNSKTILKIPKYSLNIEISNNKNIIQSALEAGVKLSFSCRSGVCGTCKAKVISGTTDNSKGLTHNLSNEEKVNNIIFTCQAIATSETLELEFLSPLTKRLLVNDGKPKEYVVEILSLNSLGNKFCELRTTFPKKIYSFLHDGMKVELIINGKISKKFNMISPKLNSDGSNNGIISIFLPKSEIDIYDYLIPGETITIIGPYKNNITVYNDNPYLFLSNLDDLIDILSKIKEILYINNSLKIMLITYFEFSKNIQFMDEMHNIQNNYKGFSYKIIISKEKIGKNTRFIYGFPENILKKIISNLDNHIIYINKSNNELLNKVYELGGLKKNIY